MDLGLLRRLGGAVAKEAIPETLGYLEAPPTGRRVKSPVWVSGWVFLKGATRARGLFASIDGQKPVRLPHGISRPDVQSHYPSFPNAANSGFEGWVPFKGGLRNTAKLRVWIELETGARVDCLSRKIVVGKLRSVLLASKFILNFAATAPKRFLNARREGRLPRSLQGWIRLAKRQFEFVLDHIRFDELITDEIAWQMDPYEQWMETNRLTPVLLSRMRENAHALASVGRTISVVVPVFNTPRRFLLEMIESVVGQIYPNWELCLANDASTEPHVRELLDQATLRDTRIKVIHRSGNGHICEATNSALATASGEYVALLDHDDVLPPDALLHVAECIAEHPDVEWIYTDEDKIDAEGRRFDPQFKGEWNPEMAITHNYTHHLSVFRRTLVERAGSMRPGFEGAQDLDLFLRVAELISPERIRHVPHVCYHWRSHGGSTASHGTQKDYVFTSARRAITEALTRRGLSADPELPPIAKQHGLCLYQLKWRNVVGSTPAVTIVIPTRDRVDLLKRCIASLERTVDASVATLIIVDDRSSESATRHYFEELQRERVLGCRVISPRGDNRFNYARLVNSALPHVATPYLLHLNNDIEAIEAGWVEDMLGWMSVPGVGAVGARLLYPDRTIQHAGVVIGPHHGLADHQFHHLPVDEIGYLALPHAARDVSAVTGACFLTRTSLYKDLGGFDEVAFGVEYNDVDFCQRLIQKGARVVYSPQATLTHVTSASRGRDFNPDEHANFLRRYPRFRDAYVSENISLDSPLMAIDGARFNHGRRMSDLNIVLVSHNLGLGGAQIVAYEIAQHYATHGNRVKVLSPKDGPIRQRYEALGIPVHILSELQDIERTPADSVEELLRSAGKTLDLPATDLVLANTITAFWAVEMASLYSVPSIWHIHESAPVSAYAGRLERSSRYILYDAFAKANRVVFQSRATRSLYGNVSGNSNFVTIPGGIPMDRIEAFQASHSKKELRAKYGIDSDAQVVFLPGTICERKGQRVFVDAIDHLCRADGGDLAERVIFVMVGAVPSAYLDFLRYRIGEITQADIRIFDETEDIYDFYCLSDIFVCASFEESFPMVVLLAMAFGMPVVSTDVYGIPEMIVHGAECRLVPPGDHHALAAAIRDCLEQSEASKRMARFAHGKAYRLFNQMRFLGAELALARAVAAEAVVGQPEAELQALK